MKIFLPLAAFAMLGLIGSLVEADGTPVCNWYCDIEAHTRYSNPINCLPTPCWGETETNLYYGCGQTEDPYIGCVDSSTEPYLVFDYYQCVEGWCTWVGDVVYTDDYGCYTIFDCGT